MEIYITRNGEQHGPFSLEQVREYVASGELLPGDLAWCERTQEWWTLEELLDALDAEEAEAAGAGHEPESPHPIEQEPVPQTGTEPAHPIEPELEREPEPAQAPSREPSWVPPRRDGLRTATTTFIQPTRSPMPFRSPSPSPSPPSSHLAPTISPAWPTPQYPPAVRSTAAATPAISDQEAHAMARRHLSSASIGAGRPKPVRAVVANGAIFFVGLAITIGTYKEAASLPHGGTYVVAWGAMLFGGFRFVMGLIQLFGD